MLDEELMSLHEMAKHLGKSYQLVLSLTKHGRTGLNGDRIKLEFVLTESGKKTSLQAYRRFLERLNDPMHRTEDQRTNRRSAETQELAGGS